MKKKLKIRACQKKADKWFSLYVRALNATDGGYCVCVTCGKVIEWRGTGQLHAGHYIGREHIPTRYDERNVHCQCSTCNSYHGGEHGKYTLFLQEKYGQDIIEELVLKGNGYAGLKAEDYLELVDMYKEKTNQLILEKEL